MTHPKSSMLLPLQYGAVLIVDPEEEFYPEEVVKLAQDVRKHGLGLLVFGEWYNADVQAKMRFFDDNTRSWWTPVTGEASAHFIPLRERRHFLGFTHSMAVVGLRTMAT